MGIQSPKEAIGLKVNNSTIVGVMKDFHMMSVKTKIQPVFFTYNGKEAGQIAFTVTPENMKTVMNTATDLYRKIFPKQMPEIEFLEDNINN